MAETAATNESPNSIAAMVARSVAATPIYDIHTHLYAPAFGDLLLWGVDEVLVYHYLVAETFRHLETPYEQFWQLPREQQAELVWKTLFIDSSPISESCRGVLTILNSFGLDPRQDDLPAIRRWYAQRNPDEFTTHCMQLANVRRICMTNSPFDSQEHAVWERGFSGDDRFATALRIDPLLLQWEDAMPQLQQWGYKVTAEFNQATFDGVRRFLDDWAKRLGALFVMVSLPPSFRYPADTPAAKLLAGAVLPFCRDSGLPFSPMFGPVRGVNPALRLAGDGLGQSDLGSLQRMVEEFDTTKFLVTLLTREGQHELCVLARKRRNVHLFGCWWFTNTPSLIDEITRMRLELLGTSFTPQHSDARVVDQIVYKWQHSKAVIEPILIEKYQGLAAAGWIPAQQEIDRDIQQLFGGAFESFLKMSF